DTLIRSTATQIANVPTPAMLAGNLAPYETNCFPSPRTLGAPYVNNVIPQSLVSPQAVKMASYFPPGPGDCGLLTYPIVVNQTENMGLAKIDWQINAKQTFFGRYYVTHSLTPSSFTGTELSVQNAGTDDEVNSIVLGHTYVFGPNALNTFRVTGNRVGITKFQVPILTPQSIGVNGVYEALPNYSNINITGDFNSAGGFATPGLVATTTYQASDDFSLIRGSHQLQFGGTYIRPGQNSTFCVYCDGLFTFSGTLTGSAFGDFISGRLSSFTQLNVTHDNERWNYFGIYAQDTWKATSHLTVNAGLRWEPYLAGRILNNWVTHFSQQNLNAGIHSTIFPNDPAGTLFPVDQEFNTGAWPNNTRWLNFAPRAGLAWDPKGDGRTILRASWGIFYDMPHTLFYYNYSSEPPWGEQISLTAPAGGFANPWQGYPGGSPYPVQINPSFSFPTAGYYETVPLNVKVTYLEQWNLSLQKQLGTSWLLKASYVGNNTIHLWTDQELNPAIYV